MSSVANLSAVPTQDSLSQGSSLSVTALGLAKARQGFKALEEWLLSEETSQLPLHEVEREQERRGREVQRLLLEAHIAKRGIGDVGRAIEVCSSETAEGGVIHTHRRLDQRHPKTIFGEIKIDRMGYSHPGLSGVHPLDDQLQLPHRSFSYELQRRLVKASVQGPFEEAIERVEESTGTMIPKRSAEQLVVEAACDFDAFYQERISPDETQTGPILIGSADGKGIPMVKATPADRVVRLGKGEKANKKKMATVATAYTQEPHLRTPQGVIDGLFATGPRPVPSPDETSGVHRRPQDKRVWASLIRSKEEVIKELSGEMDRRDPKRTKQWVVLTDGEKALQRTVRRLLLEAALVLDFQHVLEKLWGAAYAFHKEGSQEALEWVKERASRLLRGGVSQLIQGMNQSATKRKLRGQRLKAVKAATAYFYHNRGYMLYHDYLQKGWPITTGVVEGACKNLVKDRMERSGMRWKPKMAEAMLKMRAIYLSGDLEEYWAFHVQKEHERIHPPGRWRPLNFVDEK